MSICLVKQSDGTWVEKHQRFLFNVYKRFFLFLSRFFTFFNVFLFFFLERLLHLCIIQRLTQALSYFRSTCPNHLNLLFLIIKLTGSNHKSSLEFFTFLPLIQLNPTHPSDHTHFSAIQLQFMLNFHRPGLTAMHQTTSHTSSIYLAFQF